MEVKEADDNQQLVRSFTSAGPGTAVNYGITLFSKLSFVS
jgi:hypothetical protein